MAEFVNGDVIEIEIFTDNKIYIGVVCDAPYDIGHPVIWANWIGWKSNPAYAPSERVKLLTHIED